MRLKALIKTLDDYQLYPALSVAERGYKIRKGGVYCDLEDFEVSGISCNSKNILPNFVFVAIKGTKEDGHKFIQEAIVKGAKAVVVECQLSSVKCQDNKINLIKVDNARKALAKLAAGFYGNPSAKIKVVGITGTNGKTTISYLIEALLKEAGKIPGVIGTINYRFKDKVIPAKNTTPGQIELQSALADMSREGTNYVVLEVSSHALDQDRTEGIDFHCAIFTNLTGDHLDYHQTLENYFQAKAKLFQNINLHSVAIINNDDIYGRKLKELIKSKIITYGIENPADIRAADINFDISHTEFRLVAPQGEINFTSRLIGRHNVYNILAAVAFALKEGLSLSVIKSAIERFYYVPGRLERIEFLGNFLVFVDYAHTEDALVNVIKTLRQVSGNRIIVVFGCGGERDKTKRPKMGYAVSELADYAIITNDNPRSEDPLEIIEEIKKGISKKNFCVIPDRKEAINKSLTLAKSGDIVLVAGKGHENYQILNDRIIHFDDRETVRECLKSVNY